ncbi:MAG: TlpA family protein disulfide reductase [Vicinamibacterales bacterium]
MTTTRQAFRRGCQVVVLAALLGVVAVPSGNDLRPFVRGSWKQIRQAHHDQPLVVHFWGVTCAPCMTELPKWGQLHTQRPKANIVFVAADPIPIDPPNIEAAITRTGIGTAENWMFSDSFLERLRFEVNPAWGGELPYTVLIGADGTMTATAGVTEASAISAWLDKQTVGSRRTRP